MKTRKLLWIVCAFAVANVAAAVTRSNIIFLLTDDQTIGTLGCYGNKDIITPNPDYDPNTGRR